MRAALSLLATYRARPRHYIAAFRREENYAKSQPGSREKSRTLRVKRYTFPTVAYCPKCGTEYVEGTVRCEDCGESLRWGSPPARRPEEQEETEPEAKVVRIRTFSGSTAVLDAELARNVLQTQGIPCVLPGEEAAVAFPIFDIPLFVREEDAERAAQVLEDYFESPGTVTAE